MALSPLINLLQASLGVPLLPGPSRAPTAAGGQRSSHPDTFDPSDSSCGHQAQSSFQIALTNGLREWRKWCCAVNHAVPEITARPSPGWAARRAGRTRAPAGSRATL